ncbi:MAG: antitoxin VbhA family protein [Alphaproteobacteria bacterium]|nr:antitoxin VbhA family protein [Alphaproteobacteria bacterium]
MKKDPFEEFVNSSNPNIREKVNIWKVAIGLQQVDGLKPSQYLIDLAIRNIRGEITIEEVKTLLDSYYAKGKKADSDEA